MIEELHFSKYDSTQKMKLLDLLKYMWGRLNERERKERFEWRYERNPYREPYIYLAIDSKKVVGFRSFIAQVFLLRDKEYIILSPADTIVHPDYRRRGIMSKLNTICIDQINHDYENDNIILLNSTTSKKSMPLYIKEYWQKTNGIKHFYYKINFKNLVKYYTNKKNIVNKTIFLEGKYKIEITSNKNPKELSEFNNSIRKKSLFSNVHDELFYNWRYDYKPEQYSYVYCRVNDEMKGYLIIKKGTGLKFSLEEYGFNTSNVFHMLINKAMEKLNISVLRGWALTSDEKILLKEGGFIPEPANLMEIIGKERFPIIVRPKEPKPLDHNFIFDNLDIRNIENWKIQISDRH